MATKKKKPPIYRLPGRKQLQLFLKENGKLFNFSEMERQCDFAKDALRYVCRGRELTAAQYKKVQQEILPKLTEFVFLLQNYSDTVTIDPKDIYNWD